MRDADDASHELLDDDAAAMRRHRDASEADDLEQASDVTGPPARADVGIPADIPEADALEQRTEVDGDEEYEPQ